MKPIEWLQTFLRDRSLTSPDGRPLYQYRITRGEFTSLQQVLTRNEINHDSYQCWDSCFVLYASEWWRRNYASGHWGWSGIFESLKKRIDNVQLRSRLVESGIRRLKRTLYKDAAGDSDFLVTVIIECGIPVETLQKERHWLKSLITNSFEGYFNMSSSEIPISEFVRLQAESVPKSIQKEAVFELIGRMVIELKELRSAYKLQRQKSPVEFLDTAKPDWRNVFPIQVDSEISKRFLDELLTEIAAIAEPRAYPFSFKRLLKQNDTNWELYGKVTIPFRYYDHEDLRLSEDTLKSLPSRVEVAIVDSQGRRYVLGTALKTSKDGREHLRLEADHTIDSNAVYNEWHLEISSIGSVIRLPLPGSEAVNMHAPLTFILKEDKWTLQAQASYKTNADSALLLLHTQLEAHGPLETIGSFEDWGRLCILRGTAMINGNGNLYKVASRQAIEEKFEYAFSGQALPYTTDDRREVFLGIPNIYRQNPETLTKTVSSGTTEIRPIGLGNIWNPAPNGYCGVCEIRHRGKDGEVFLNRHVSILPKDFSIDTSAKDLQNGKITLSQSSPFDVTVYPSTIGSRISATSSGHEVEVNNNNLDGPAEKVMIGLRRKGEQGEIKITIPFPAKGARLFSRDGKLLKRNETIFFDDLQGARLYLFNPSPTSRTFVVKLGLQDQFLNESQEIGKQVEIAVQSSVKEIPLVSLASDVKSLFLTNLDASVRLRVSEAIASESASIQIKRYANERLVLDTSSGRITLDPSIGLNQDMKLAAFRLNIPLVDQQVSEIVPHHDEVNQFWELTSQVREEGVWIVFPSKSCHRLFRPRVWIVGERQQTDDQSTEIENIWDAAYVKDPEFRIQSLKGLFDKISVDCSDRNWNELDILTQLTDHLPLATFNVWHAVAKSPKALTTLFFRNEFVIDRLTQEFPVLWESVPIENWQVSFKNFVENYRSYPADLQRAIINRKIDSLSEMLGLEFLTMLLRNTYTGDEIPKTFDARLKDWLRQSIKEAYLGRNGSVGLCHKQTEWPTHLSEEIGQATRGLPNEILSLFPQQVPNHRKSVMYLPALLAYKTINKDSYPYSFPANVVLRMRSLIQFDPEWFKYVFNTVQGYCWVNGIK
jgi:hypothetical protein